MYELSRLRSGHGRLTPIEEAELGAIAPNGWTGLRVLHLQCHFGADSLVLAQRGAEVVGLDFSEPAVLEARRLADELGLSDRARFIHANLYDARRALPEPEGFDVVFTSWGAIAGLPDVAEWARIVAWFLKPGGRFYFADTHPAAAVFASDPGSSALPSFAYPYDGAGDAIVIDAPGSHADAGHPTVNSVSWEWMHPLGETVTALLDAGLSLDFLHEHYALPYRMFELLQQDADGMWTWPDRRWLPLAVSIGATL